MASVRSLGIHTPSAIPFLVAEGILPPDPSPKSYRWQPTAFQNEDDTSVEEELLLTPYCVVWSQAAVVKRIFRFDIDKEPVSHALFAKFPTPDQKPAKTYAEYRTGVDSAVDDQGLARENRPKSKNGTPYMRNEAKAESEARNGTNGLIAEEKPHSRALVVILKTHAHIFYLPGPSHLVHLPFEVGSAFAVLPGVVLQRKTPSDSDPPSSQTLPTVPQNTFRFSQQSTLAANGLLPGIVLPSPNNNLPIPKSLGRLTSKQGALTESNTPSLCYLSDPIANIGFVFETLGPHDFTGQHKGQKALADCQHLSANENLLYLSEVDELDSPSAPEIVREPFFLAVTENAEKRTITIWNASRIASSIFSKQKDSVQTSYSRSSSQRKSSFVSHLSTGATTPVPKAQRQPSREAKKLADEGEKRASILDTALEQAAGPSKSSRRASSLLVREDLSGNTERPAFAELSANQRGQRIGRRGLSFGSISSTAVPENETSRATRRLTSDLIPDLDAISADEVALIDADNIRGQPWTSRLASQPEYTRDLNEGLLLTRVHTEPNVPSLHVQNQGGSHPRVFILRAPSPPLNNPFGNRTLLLCLVNRQGGELIVFQAQVALSRQQLRSKSSSSSSFGYALKIHCTKRSGIRDACKVAQGPVNRILVLDAKSNSLTLQAPWATLMKVAIPYPLNVNNPSRIHNPDWPWESRGGGLKRVIQDLPQDLLSVGNADQNGCFDIEDANQNKHRLAIQLKPSDPFVLQLINVAEAVLPASEHFGEPLLRAWWDAMSFLQTRKVRAEDLQWVAFAVAICLLGVPFVEDSTPPTSVEKKRRRGGLMRSSSGVMQDPEDWDNMMKDQTPLSSKSPLWTQSKAWSWTKLGQLNAGSKSPNRNEPSALSQTGPSSQKISHLLGYVNLSRELAKTQAGQGAVGEDGYLPIAHSKDRELRRTALASVLVALHLFREELKLDILSNQHVHYLTPLLAQFGTWLGWAKWSFEKDSFYMLESADLHLWEFQNSRIKGLETPHEPFRPPSFHQHLELIISEDASATFPTLLDVVGAPTEPEAIAPALKAVRRSFTPRTMLIASTLRDCITLPANTQILELQRMGFDPVALDQWPVGVAAVYRALLNECQATPSSKFSHDLLKMIDREDVARLGDVHAISRSRNKPPLIASTDATRDVHLICHQTLDIESVGAYDDAAEIDRQSIIKLLFKEDRRFADAAKMLHPLHHSHASCIPEPGWSEAEFLEAQQELAKVVALRTLSVSLGRGLLFFGSRLPLMTEKFPIHGFTLSCHMKPTDTTVTADRNVFTEEKVSWAFFHAGVEAGLSISKHAKGVNSSWILFNKPRDLTNRHAGFLFALGLIGHLKSIAKWVAFKYLTPKHNMTSIGLLLGLAASKIGSMDSLVTRLLSVHVTRMLPPGSAELNLSSLTQTCGIMGIGLLYCSTQHRRMSEIMLSEMEAIDAEEGVAPLDALRDEGYRVSAGFAFGFINLGCGHDLRGMRDMHIMERLLALAVATKQLSHDRVADKATAGAIMALTMIFMKTNDIAVANKINVPDTPHQFEYVRPDHFLLRTTAKHIILWDAIGRDADWMKSEMPPTYKRREIGRIHALSSEDLPYYNILAGLCLSLGLRYAGSADLEVRDLLCDILDHFIRICKIPAPTYDSKLARITVRNCMDVISLSVAAVMAGSGDLKVLRRLRSLHGRSDAETNYGSHLAAHFALGVVFLGGGTHSLNTSNLAIGSLLCAFYPLFPTTVQDNKSHLQAFRHLWVLAAENRCVVPRDIYTDRPVSVPISVVHEAGASQTFQAPCLLPQLEDVRKVRIDHADYWPLELDFSDNPVHLRAFKSHQSMFLRRRDPTDGSQTAVFSNTVKALNNSQLRQQLRSQPFDWIFNLASFRRFDRWQAGLVVPYDFASIVETVSQFDRGTHLDDILTLETSSLASGRSEDLWNLRLLLAWDERCKRDGREIKWITPRIVAELRSRIVLWGRQSYSAEL